MKFFFLNLNPGGYVTVCRSHSIFVEAKQKVYGYKNPLFSSAYTLLFSLIFELGLFTILNFGVRF